MGWRQKRSDLRISVLPLQERPRNPNHFLYQP
jgi:hypothetical protein